MRGIRTARGTTRRTVRGAALAAAFALVATACSDDSNGTDDDAATTEPATADTGTEATGDTDDDTDAGITTDDTAAPTTADENQETEPDEVDDEPDGLDLPPATLDGEQIGGVEQITILDAEPGVSVAAMNPDDEEAGTIAFGTVDEYGSLVLRGLDITDEYVLVVEGGEGPTVEVLDRYDHPDAAFYAEQRLPAPGFGYLETRDGTTLSVNVVLPGPVEDGPYPTVVEYSGYTPSDPDAAGFKDLFPALGYAYVGVNMRGTGCSGGSYRFFEYTQSTDGYDAIEAVAAQPWVLDQRVGMVGVSYPGISQLFVAQTQPPSLAAITPLSVIDDAYRSTLYPGGLLNTGFAVEWTQARLDEARPAIGPDGLPTDEGQVWAAARIADGDEECATNQRVRLQNPDLVQEIVDTPYYERELGDEIAPARFADAIEVPTLLAGAWQDEQTGGRFPAMLDDFGTDDLYVSLLNGLHTDSISPAVFPRFVEFLDLYVARRVPSLDTARALVPVLAAGLFGTGDVELPPDRFTGMSYDEALATFEADPPIQILFENGAAEGVEPLTPLPRFTAGFDAWPIPETTPRTWHLSEDGRLLDEPVGDDGRVEYLAVPDGVPATFWQGDSSALWRTDVEWNWQEPAPGTFASFTTAPLDETLTMVGPASADLWVNSNLGDTDLEVTLSEIRPDGSEVYVQSGWLRASQRALDENESTVLRPAHSQLEDAAEPLPGPEDPEPFALARVEVFPFAHVFRAGSQIRLAVDAPGGNRAVWVFDTIGNGERVQIGIGPSAPSQLVLPVVPGIEVPADPPACDSLRGQPCRL